MIVPRPARLLAALLFGCGLGTLRLPAQSASDTSLRNFQSRQWLKEDGLPDNYVTTLLQSRDQYLWIGTLSGLVRFDGVRFESALAVPAITALYEDAAGVIWVGAANHGLFVQTNNVFVPFTPVSGALPTNITCLAQDRAGDYWIGAGSGLARLSHGQVRLFTTADGLPDNFVSAVHGARSGALWITTRAGMCEWRDGQLFPLELQTQGLGRNPEFLGIYEDSQTNLWAFGDTFLVNLKDGKRFNYFRNGDLASFRIWSLCEGRNGQLWIGTSGQGIFSFTQGPYAPVSFRERLVSSDVRAICEDNQGDVWLGTFGGGLIRMKPRAWQLVGPGSGLPDEPATSIALTPEGRLWAGFMQNGLFNGTPNRLESSGAAFAGAPPLIASLASVPDGSLWVGTYGDGVYHLRENVVKHFTTADGLSDNVIPALCADAAGAIWVGCRSGLVHKIADNKILEAIAPAGPSGAPISCVSPAVSGGVWIGSGAGRVCRADDAGITPLALPAALAGKAIRALFEDSQGVLWIGAEGAGLACAGPNLAKHFDSASGFADTDVHGIDEDRDHNIWVRASRALWRIPRRDLAGPHLAEIRAEQVFTESPGLPGLELPGSPGAARGPDGALYFISTHGLLQIDPRAWRDDAQPLPVRLESVTLNDQPLPLARGPVRLSAQTRSLEFRFTAIDLSSPERVRFQRQLENFDADWVDGGAERFVRYGRLPPGKYRFRVRASRGNGVWCEAPDSFAFELTAPAWKSGGAIALYSLLGIIMVAAVVRLISHRRLRHNLALLGQQQAMEKERMRIAQNMHDEIGSQLTRISFLSEIALRGQEPARENLQSIAVTSQQLLQTLDEIVWAVNPQNDTLEHLAAYLGHYADEYFQNTGVELEMQIAQGLRQYPLSSEARHNLFLAFEEALGNVLKHSGAARVRIEMEQSDARFVIRVHDEGRGFRPDHAGAPSGKPARNGIVNMKERLAQLGGACRVEAAPGAGTTVILVLPLPAL
ncbi:MAG TPA: two-component regulator propeller domain-containing protein [Verrucomicrobiae bacterium]|jgi:ligand-binding sensor domain-containing protein/signal transduction histidine kinase|nr:two-component regulator propeller domain-containing protein [Verrucomicrobiae bacterium]